MLGERVVGRFEGTDSEAMSIYDKLFSAEFCVVMVSSVFFHWRRCKKGNGYVCTDKKLMGLLTASFDWGDYEDIRKQLAAHGGQITLDFVRAD